MPNSENQKTPLVSICCITYNQEDFIADAIEGFLMQKTEFPYEILIGEDCSTDRTKDIVLGYAESNPDRIKLFISEKNMGGQKNFENLTEQSRGKYIALCEGDDYWTDPLKIQKQIAFLERNPECMMSFHASKVITAKKLSTLRTIRPFQQDHLCTVEEIIRIAGAKIPTQSKVYRKQVVADLPQWYLSAHVGDMAKDLLIASRGTIAYMDETMSVYRLAVKGSWTRSLYTGPDVIKKKIGMLHRDIALYEAFNEGTGFEYNQVIEEVNSVINHGISLISDTALKEKLRNCREIRKSMGLWRGNKMILKYFLLVVFARYQILKIWGSKS